MTQKAKEKRLKVGKIFILFFTLFVGIGAFAGGICMLIKPDGSILQMQELLKYFQVLPFADVLFQDYIFSGISLIIVNGITNVTAAILIIKNKKIGYILGTIFGFTLMLWIIIQFVLFPSNALDTIYFTLGILQLITGFIAYVFYKQTTFIFNEADYKICKDSKTLVVYFSRMGYTKKEAYEIAIKENAEIYEIKTKERTENTLGFWWCGRFGMHQWPMEIEKLNIDLARYNKIIIVSPIWVFRMCGPIRGFIKEYAIILNEKEIDVVLNHFNPWLPKGAIDEIKSLIKINKVSSYSCQYGNFREKNLK